MRWSHSASGREEREVGSVGIKRGKKGKRWREGALRNHQSPSWGSSLFGFILGGGGNTPHTGEGEQTGGWREREEDGGRKQHGEREEEGKGVIYGGGKLPGSERVKREAVREEWRGGQRSQEKGDDMRREGTEKGDIWVKKCLCTYKSSNM